MSPRRRRAMVLQLAGLVAMTLILPLIVAKAVRGQEPPEGCAARATMAQILAETFGEKPVATGLSEGGLVVEVWATADGDTWTITTAKPGGLVCYAIGGKGWTAAAPGKPA